MSAKRLKGLIKSLQNQGYDGPTTVGEIVKGIEADSVIKDVDVSLDGKTYKASKAVAILIEGIASDQIMVEDVPDEEMPEEEMDGDLAMTASADRGRRIANASKSAAMDAAGLRGGVLTKGILNSPEGMLYKSAARRYDAKAQSGRKVNGVKSTVFSDHETAAAFAAYARLRISEDGRRGTYKAIDRDRDIYKSIAGVEAYKALGSGVPGSGADLVVSAFSNDIIDVLKEVGIARKLISFQTLSAEQTSIFKRGARPTIYASGQNPANGITTSDAGTQQVRVNVTDFFGLTYASRSWFEDTAIDAADFIANAHIEAHAETEDECLINGDGSATYGGIVGAVTGLTSIASNAGVIVGSGNAWSELSYEDHLKTMTSTRQTRGRGREVGVCHKTYFGQVLVPLQADAGSGQRQVAFFNEDGTGGTFAGRDIVFHPGMPSTEANSQIPFLFGDFDAAFAVGERRAVEIASDESTRFEYDQIAFRSKHRFDMQFHDAGTSSEAGTVVGLQTAAS